MPARLPTPQRPPSVRPILAHWREVLTPPDDPALVAAGHQGELMVARVRLWTAMSLIFVPIFALAYGPRRPENLTALVGTAFAAMVALVILELAKRGIGLRALPVVSTLFDVTLVTVLQATYLVQGLHAVAVNSRTTFLAYFVAIAAACLRWDPRLCLMAGVAALLQYGIIVVVASTSWPALVTEDMVIFGLLVPGQQYGRLLILAVFTFVCVIIVRQSLTLRISSTHDALTRLMNRAYFEERLTDELSRAARHEIPVCVALVDIDHFKRVNDVHGHAVGDAALRLVAQVLARTVRRSDLVGRWGGEEFVIAFPETRLAEAFGKLEQLRMEIASHTLVLSTGGEVQLTISGGLAVSRLDGTTLRDLVEAADHRLLEAKRTGRNRVLAAADVRSPSGDWRVVVPRDGAATRDTTPPGAR